MLRAYFGLIRKEFLQVFRDHNMLRVILAVPIIQLLVLGYAVNIDVKNIALDVYDYDQSRESRELVQAMRAGEYFVTPGNDEPATSRPLWHLDSRFTTDKAEMALIIPEDFSERLVSGGASIGLVADGANAYSARTGIGYATQIVNRFSGAEAPAIPVTLRQRFLYNPEAESVYYMVPGIVATLLTMITVMLTAMAIVREREVGTLEQLLVTPISSLTLVMGKVTTFAILGIFELSLALAVGILWFGIPFVGSPLLLFALSLLYLLTTLGVGMFISTATGTQQQAMFYAWFFSIFAILTSGFFTPIANMPQWIQYVTYINPMRYFMTIVRGIMMKGAGPADLLQEVLALVLFGVVIFGCSLLRFKKRTA